MPVIDIKSERELKKIVDSNNGRLIVLDYYADWCGPCKALGPKISEFAKMYPHVIFLKVNVDSFPGFAERSNVTSMPTVAFYKSGRKLCEVIGVSIPKIRKALETHSN